LITETAVLQDLRFSSDLKFATISKVRFCKTKEPDCAKGTYLSYYNFSSNLVKQFVCLECDPLKYKIIMVHKFLRNIPFDLEDNIGEFHRNIQSPYFVCGDVANVVRDCEYYMDYSNKESKFGKILKKLISRKSRSDESINNILCEMQKRLYWRFCGIF
jgi:hypothetical protein